jgi:hypothetical protein
MRSDLLLHILTSPRRPPAQMMDINFGLEHEVVTNGGAPALVLRQTWSSLLHVCLPMPSRLRRRGLLSHLDGR